MTDTLYDTEIPWRLKTLSRTLPQQAEPATADEVGLLYADIVTLDTHLASVQADLAIYRELVQTSLEHIAALTARLDRQSRRMTDQTRQIRELLGLVAVDARDDQGDPAGP